MKNYTGDLKGLHFKELPFKYACYCFSLLINSTHLSVASEYFRLICIIFLSEYNTPLVVDAKEKIKAAVANRPETEKEINKLFKSIRFDQVGSIINIEVKANAKDILNSDQNSTDDENSNKENENSDEEDEDNNEKEEKEDVDSTNEQEEKAKTIKGRSPFTKHFDGIHDDVVVELEVNY
jgi:hypothetical protein